MITKIMACSIEIGKKNRDAQEHQCNLSIGTMCDPEKWLNKLVFHNTVTNVLVMMMMMNSSPNDMQSISQAPTWLR